MKSVFQRFLNKNYLQGLMLPHGSEFLYVAYINGMIESWWLVPDKNAPLKEYEIYIFGNYDSFPDAVLDFMGTLLIASDFSVSAAHVFMKKKNWVGDQYG